MTSITLKIKQADKLIGRKIEELRLSKGLSRAALSKYIDVTHQQLEKYETGKNRISPGRLKLAAIALNVPVHEFYEDDDKPMKVEHQRQALEVMRNLAGLPLELQSAFGYVIRVAAGAV